MVAAARGGHSDERARIRLASAELEKTPSLEMLENESNVASGQARIPKSRTVSFFPGVSVRECLHINNFTDDEVYNTWYKKPDFSRIKTSFIYIVQKLSNGSWEGDTENETARGLEYRTREGSMKRKVNKLNGLMVVLDEQESQWNRGIHDDEAIAAAYRDVSCKSLELVRLLAARDEAEVLGMWADDIDFVSKKLSAVKVGSPGKRAYNSPEQEEGKKKVRVKEFLKKMQVNQHTGSNHRHRPSSKPPDSSG
jgi:hypothetical protein